MNDMSGTPTHPAVEAFRRARRGGVVRVFQGGGALGAYQVGVYQALHEAGIEPDWIIGTSIGAINAALLCGNEPEHRMGQLDTFWREVEQQALVPNPFDVFGFFAWLRPGARGRRATARLLPPTP